MNLSRVIGWLSFAATALTGAAAVLGTVKPAWAVYVLAVSGSISAFVERVQGGKSKVTPQ